MKKFITDKILSVTNEELDSLNMEEDYHNYKLNHNWYILESKKEHYRLLKYISNLINNTNLIDVGTYRGCSALALSDNCSNTVYSFDLTEQPEIKNIIKDNIVFKIEDITKNNENYNLLKASPFVMLDTDHDGTFEHIFYNYLKKINWTGVLMLDDIYLNDPMKNFWDMISEEKYDITCKGHFTGTGLVIL